MEWLAKLFRGIGSFFKRVAKTAIGEAIQTMEDAAREVVHMVEAEFSGKSGTEKFNVAFDMLTAKYPNFRSGVINLAIQMAWAAMVSAMGEGPERGSSSNNKS